MQWFMTLLAENSMIRDLQLGLVAAAVVAVYLVFYTTRDILLRSKSFVYQMISIILVAGLPIVGFFIYLLIRPASTVRQRELEKMLKKVQKKDSKEVKDSKDSKDSKAEHDIPTSL